MKYVKFLQRRPLLSLLLLFLLLELLPVSGKDAAAVRVYEGHDFRGEYTTYYVLHPSGDLVSWGHGPLDHNYTRLYSDEYPYFLRKTLARGVTDFACTSGTILYVDEDHILWGDGVDQGLLRSETPERVRIMEDVEQVAADDHHGLALKTDGSLWIWNASRSTSRNERQGADPLGPPPVRIAENIQSIFLVDSFCFALTEENTLLHWNTQSRKLELAAQDVKEISWLCSNNGRLLYHYLTQQGEVYVIKPHSFEKVSSQPIAEDVAALCEQGFIKKDHSLWIWEGSSIDGRLVKYRNGVQSADSSSFYVDVLGHLHWKKYSWPVGALPRSIRWLNPAFRNAEALLLLLCLLYKRRKGKQSENQARQAEADSLQNPHS